MENLPDLSFFKFLFTDPFGLCYFVLPVLLAFTGQLLLCFRTKGLLLRLLPAALGLLVLGAVYGAFLLFGENLLYLYPLGIAGLIFLGSASGWAVYAAVLTARRL